MKKFKILFIFLSLFLFLGVTSYANSIKAVSHPKIEKKTPILKKKAKKQAVKVDQCYTHVDFYEQCCDGSVAQFGYGDFHYDCDTGALSMWSMWIGTSNCPGCA